MHRRAVMGTGAVVAASLLAGCLGGGGDPSGEEQNTEESDPGVRTVTISGTNFRPRTVSVEPGTTVEWVNEGDASHTVSAANFSTDASSWSFSSDTIERGGSATHTFEEAGIYQYFCTIHGKSTMCGAVLVGGERMDNDLPCASSGDDGGGGGGVY